MLGMTKTFNCINRNKLIEDLRNTKEADELHKISKLLNVLLSVRCENALSEAFKTDTGVSKGDCDDHSYVEQTRRSNITDSLTEHNYFMVT